MRVVPCIQGSPEWHAARLGIPTASEFHRLVTPTGNPSSQAAGYLHQLVAERLLGRVVDETAGAWVERGKITEGEAVAYYELQRGLDTQAVGFVTTDDRQAGCSPDRLIGPDGGLEIKCPSAAVHVGYLLDVEPKKYWPQIQGALWVTGREWWDFLSYCPELPPALMRFERDEKYIEALAMTVTEFAADVGVAYRRLQDIIGGKAA